MSQAYRVSSLFTLARENERLVEERNLSYPNIRRGSADVKGNNNYLFQLL